MKGGQVPTAKDQRRRESLQNGRGAIEFAVNVMRKVFGNLQDAALDLGLFEAGHAIKAIDGKAEQWRGKRDGKQIKKVRMRCGGIPCLNTRAGMQARKLLCERAGAEPLAFGLAP